MPNMGYGPALWQIAFGTGFEYGADGIFDRTHVRFFARRNIEALLGQADWDVERWGPGLRSRAARAASRISQRRLNEWLAYQWFVVAPPRRARGSSRAYLM